MRKHLFIGIVIFYCLGIQIPSFAFNGNGEIKFQNISVKEGLSHIGATNIYQDPKDSFGYVLSMA